MTRLGRLVGAWVLAGGAGSAQARPRAPEPVEDAEALDEAESVDEPSTLEDGVDEAVEDAGDVEPYEDVEPSEPVESPKAVEPGQPVTPASASTHDVPAADFENTAGLAPGGYHGFGTILERAPPDGHNQIVVGSILVPLGTIATVSSAVGTWLSVPGHCAERLGAAGIQADAKRCQGLFVFNVIRVSYGALMLGSGATILVLGLLQRERHRKWKHEHGMRARVEPVIGLPSRTHASLGLRIRF